MKNKKRMKGILSLIAVVVSLLSLFHAPAMGTVMAAQPKVMVVDYSVNKSKITAGGEFTLSVTIKNTASRTVSNLKMIVASEGGEIIPAEGAGTGYLELLEGGSEYTFSFQMKASDGLEEKSYKLTITNEYDDRYGEPYTVTDVIYLPVSIEQRAEITGVNAESDVVLGDSIEIMGNVSNLGTSMLYNVKARVKADFVAESDTYIGNIEPGKNGSIDILTNTIHTTAANGEPGSIIVTYEDKSGNVTTLEDTFILSVEAPVYTDIEKVKDTTKKDYSKTIGISIAGGVIVVLIVVLAVKRRKRKKAILEEF